MALDRFIHFRKNPLWTDLCTTVLQYFGPEAEVRFDRPWIVVNLPSKESFVNQPDRNDGRVRGLEIHQNTKMRNIDVMTRLTDQYTNALAEGLADLIARMYSGKREEETPWNDLSRTQPKLYQRCVLLDIEGKAQVIESWGRKVRGKKNITIATHWLLLAKNPK